jgi:hypothetical protein
MRLPMHQVNFNDMLFATYLFTLFGRKEIWKTAVSVPLIRNAIWVRGNLQISGFENLMKLSAGQFHRMFSFGYLFKQQDNFFL